MKKLQSAQSPNRSSALLRSLWAERLLFSVVILGLLSLYIFGFREQFAVASCHENALQGARTTMQRRSQATPDNAQFREAATRGMFAQEDFQPLFRTCMMQKGFVVGSGE